MLFFRSVGEVVQRAQKLRGEGKVDKAISTLEAVLSDSEEDFEPYLVLGNLYCSKENYHDAALAFRNALSLIPSRRDEVLSALKESYKPEQQKVPELSEVMFDSYLGVRDFENAAACIAPLPPREIDKIAEKYRQIIKTSEDYAGDKGAKSKGREASARYSLAMLSAARGNLTEYFQTLIAVAKLELSESPTVEAELKRFVTKKTKEAPPHLGFGDYYLAMGQVGSALKEYGEALRTDKTASEALIAKLEPLTQSEAKNPDVWECLGDAYLAKRLTDKATQAYARVVQLDEKRIDHLIPKYKEITKLSAKDAAGYLALGDLHLQNKRYDLAITEYAKIPELDRSYLPQVLDRYTQILASQPDNASALEACVTYRIEAGELDKAVGLLATAAKASDKVDELIIEQLTHVLERDLHHVAGLDLLARMYLRRKSFTESLELYRHLVKLSPEAQGLAIQGLREIVRLSPSLLEAKIALGEALIIQGKYSEALAEFSAVLQRDTTLQGQVFPFLDKIMRSDKALVEKVMEVYNSMQTAGSETLITLFALGEAKAEKGDYRGSVEQFHKVLSQDPTKLDAVIQGYEKILQHTPGAGPIHLALADARIEKGQASEAIASLRSALAADQSMFDDVVFRYNRLREAMPDDPEVRDAILEALLSLKVYDQAQEQAEGAIASGVDPAFPYLVLGKIQLEKGELTKSVTNLLHAVELRAGLSGEVSSSLRRIIAIDQGNIPAHYVLAKVETLERHFDPALDEYQIIVRLDPQRVERVIADIKALLEVDPLNARGHFILADLQLRAGNPQEASQECERTVDLNPEYLAKVIPIYQEIIARDPENAKANFALGKVQVQQGAIGPAIQSFQAALTKDKTLLEPAIFELRKILDQDPGNCPARLILAGIFRESGQRDQAAVLLQEVLNLDPYGAGGALADLESLLSEDPQNAKARLALAETYLVRRELGPALDHYERLCEDPGDLLPKIGEDLKVVAEETQGKDPLAQFVLGKALLRAREVSEAIRALDLATRLDSGLRDKAISLLEGALAAGQREIPALKLLGLLRLEGKEYLKSAEVFLSAIKTVKDKTDAGRFYLCLSQSLAGLGDKKKSREALLQAHRISPNVKAIEEEIQALADRRSAIEIQGLRKIMESKGEDVSIREKLALTLSEAGRHEEALGLLEPQIPGLSGEDQLRMVALAGRIQQERGQPGLAIELLRSHSGPEGALSAAGLSYLWWLARSYESTGQWAQAYALYQKVAAQNPNYEEVSFRLLRAARRTVAQDLEHGQKVLEKIL